MATKEFSIKDLECYSGIKAHTIRVWEKRYRIFTPSRTPGNRRHYQQSDLGHLLSIALLNRNGFKISKLYKMDSSLLEQKAASLPEAFNKQAHAVNKLIYHMFSADIFEFERVLDECVAYFGIDATLKNVIIQFLEKVNMLSYINSTNEVHLAVTATRKKIMLGIEMARPAIVLNKTILLFLPEKVHYDLTLLYMAYLLKSHGARVVYLGTNVPIENIIEISRQKQPDVLCTYLTEHFNYKFDVELGQFLSKVPGTMLCIAGSTETMEKRKRTSSITYLHYSNCEQLLI